MKVDSDPINHGHYTSQPSGVECIEIWQHKQTCGNYRVVSKNKFKIPFVKKWITIIRYVECDMQDDLFITYFRFEFDFKRKFSRFYDGRTAANN